MESRRVLDGPAKQNGSAQVARDALRTEQGTISGGVDSQRTASLPTGSPNSRHQQPEGFQHDTALGKHPGYDPGQMSAAQQQARVAPHVQAPVTQGVDGAADGRPGHLRPTEQRTLLGQDRASH